MLAKQHPLRALLLVQSAATLNHLDFPCSFVLRAIWRSLFKAIFQRKKEIPSSEVWTWEDYCCIFLRWLFELLWARDYEGPALRVLRLEWVAKALRLPVLVLHACCDERRENDRTCVKFVVQIEMAVLVRYSEEVVVVPLANTWNVCNILEVCLLIDVSSSKLLKRFSAR